MQFRPLGRDQTEFGNERELPRLLILVLLFILAIAPGRTEEAPRPSLEPNEWRENPANWKGELKLATGSFKAGEKIPLHFIARNVSESNKRLVVTYPFRDYWIEIKTADGKIVSYAAVAKHLRLGASYSVRMVLIGSGGEWDAELNLAEYFQLTAPGRYTVSARRHYSWAGISANGKITPDETSSDPKPLTFTVVP